MKPSNFIVLQFIILFFCLPYGSTVFAQLPESNCSDDIDSDGDGLTDCADPDCIGILACDNAIPCEEEAVFYQILDGNTFVRLDPENGSFVEIYQNNYRVNAIGYNTQDGFIYGIRSTPPSMRNHLVKIGMDGVFEDQGPIENLPFSSEYIYLSGDFDNNGRLFINNTQVSNIYEININERLVASVYPQSFALTGITELVYLPDSENDEGKFYSLNRIEGNLLEFNPATGILQHLGPLSPSVSCDLAFGAGFADSSGFLYFFCNSSGEVLKVDPDNMSSEFVLNTSTLLELNDGASCPFGSFSLQEPVIFEEFVSICAGEDFQGFTEAGIYTDTSSTENGDSIWILDLNVEPVYAIEIDTQICLNQSFEGYTESGQYIDTLQSLFGCDSIRTINLDVVENPMEVIDTILCAGESFQGYTESGLYIDSISISGSCDLIRTIKLTVLESEPFLEDGLFCDSTSVTLTSPSPNTQWSTGEVGSNIEVNSEGIITAFYIDENGCVQVDTVRINLLTATAYVPNIFSPNSDNINDLFQPYFSRNASGEISYELSIFNRWGELVAVVTEDQKGWNGVNKKTNKPCEQGIYLYELRIFSLTCPERRMVGSLTLLR
ncbi:MAG: gliding motility-associated C-terminal domain-containing protein [Bacteroidota bacterium]